MAMRKTNYTVTVYKNTGFNGTDIPRTGTVLETAQKIEYLESYYLREDVDLPQITVNDNYHRLKDVDYVKLTPSTYEQGEPPCYYYFATPTPMSGGVTALSLELDALTTMGGASELNYISGWEERGHIAKSDDVIFGNRAAEEWTPTQPLEITEYKKIEADNPLIIHPAQDLQIILTNIDLVKLGKQTANGVQVIAAGDIDPATGELTETNMYLPSIEISQEPTSFFITEDIDHPEGGLSSLYIPNMTAYDATNPTVQAGLRKLYSCGQLQLQGSYTIPREYVIERIASVSYTTKTEDGRYINITGYGDNKIIADMPFEYDVDGYTVKNKKVYNTFRSYTIANVASGCTITKDASLLKHGNDAAPNIKITADASSTGKPSARFITDNSATLPFVDTCTGSPWVSSQVLMEGASGSMWNSINAAFTQQTLDRQWQMNSYQKSVAQKNYNYDTKELEMGTFKQTLETVGTAIASTVAIAGSIAAAAPTGGASLVIPAAVLGSGVSGLTTSGVTASQLNTRQGLARARLETQNEAQQQSLIKEGHQIFQNINENNIGLLKSNSVVAPTPYFTPDPNLAMYGMNAFIVYQTKKTRADLIAEDKYYQRYGYNGLHRPLTRECFTCREYYTYVQAFDVNVKASFSVGLRVRQKAIAQLNSGVRVWSVLPDPQYYETN